MSFTLTDAHLLRGDKEAALKVAQIAKQAAQKLANDDSLNVLWQLDLARSCWKIYSATDVDAVTERRQVLTQGLAILKSLETGGEVPHRAKNWLAEFSKALAEL